MKSSSLKHKKLATNLKTGCKKHSAIHMLPLIIIQVFSLHEQKKCCLTFSEKTLNTLKRKQSNRKEMTYPKIHKS